MLCVPSARHLFGTASLASSALSASAELLVKEASVIVITARTTTVQCPGMSAGAERFSGDVEMTVELMH